MKSTPSKDETRSGLSLTASDSFVAHAFSVPRRDSSRRLGRFRYPSCSNLQNPNPTRISERRARISCHNRPSHRFHTDPSACAPRLHRPKTAKQTQFRRTAMQTTTSRLRNPAPTAREGCRTSRPRSRGLVETEQSFYGWYCGPRAAHRKRRNKPNLAELPCKQQLPGQRKPCPDTHAPPQVAPIGCRMLRAGRRASDSDSSTLSRKKRPQVSSSARCWQTDGPLPAESRHIY